MANTYVCGVIFELKYLTMVTKWDWKRLNQNPSLAKKKTEGPKDWKSRDRDNPNADLLKAETVLIIEQTKFSFAPSMVIISGGTMKLPNNHVPRRTRMRESLINTPSFLKRMRNTSL